MDFKNLCQNIDVSSLRARIPSMPAMPAMPQIKLPKSLPKLRPRRIFSRSREDLSRSKGSTKEQQPQQQSPSHQLTTRPSIPPADFINHSPRRISTISSLMHQETRGDSQRGTYRSACSVDDDYPSPRQFQSSGHLSRPLSPTQTPINGVTSERDAEATVAKMSLTEKLQKGYKDITEFRLSHIFAKKTVVRKDIIQVDQYVERFNEDRERELAEQERRDRKIADNYSFNFKLSRQDTDNSKRSMSSNDSPKQEANEEAKHAREHSEDESGMDVTPPPRKPGIASTRFARVRNPPLEQYISDESNNELDEDEEMPTVHRGNKQKQASVQSSPESAPNEPEGKHVKALSKLRSLGIRSDEISEKLGEKKRRAPLSPQQSEEKPERTVAAENDNPLSVLKQNIKRFSKSIRRTHEAEGGNTAANAADETEGEGTPKEETKQISRREKLTARLRKFASRDASTENLDEASPKKTEEQRSPIRAVITNKLQTWKKSFKRKPSEADAQTGEETSPEREGDKEKRSDNLMKKLRNMRQRKHATSTDDLDGTEDEAYNTPTGKSKDGNSRKTVNFEERFEQARQRTLKKVNEKIQNIKFFHKSQENIEKESGTIKRDAGKQSAKEDEEQSDDECTVYVRPCTAARRAAAHDTPSDSEEEEEQPERDERVEETKNIQHEIDGTQIEHTRAIWTTKNLLTESLDSEIDTEYPRVLIHQDHSDQFESTLIIAVTRPAPPTPTTPIIEEIHDDMPKKPPRASRTPSPGSSRAEWIPNNEIISTFLEITPPSKRRLSAEAILPAPRGHTRKMSMDSNSDSDSWIPDTSARTKHLGQQSKEGSLEGASAVILNSIDENEEPWKVHHTLCEEKLYKTKSIDIFEASVRKGGAHAAFDDFEDELRDEPVLRVPQRHIDSSFEKDSSEEPFAADDDNSSRITKILVSVIREECAEVQENVDEKEEIKLPQVAGRQFFNSNESLIANLDENENNKLNENEDDDESKEYDDDDRPPSAAPSPPPSMSPPPPPLPLRKSALITSQSVEESPPHPIMKPPMPPTKPTQPPRIPDRTPSMNRIAKPLVKTSSLRLAYNEQVKPSDVGKVNKLISRFETPQSNVVQRPRIIQRRLTRDESEEYSDDEDDLEENDDSEQNLDAFNANTERDITPTNTPRTYSLESDTESLGAISKHVVTKQKRVLLEEEDTVIMYRNTNRNGNQTKVCHEIPRITLNFDNNSNLSLSRASSEYGSPLEYPSSLIGSTETTPIPERRPQDSSNTRNVERNRRSMTRDDDKFLSFDSDDENSYYSISSTSSSRYVVEI